ncbi:hypothetical protein IAT40_002875 [Kwoniella sp. CBS 6097]
MSAPPPLPPGTGAGPGSGRPTSPRSPRPAPSTLAPTTDGGAGTPGVPGAIPPGSFVVPPELQGQHPPRPNISSMLFMTAFFFFMSGGNHYPASGGLEVGPDGEIRHKMSELDHARLWRDEWRGVVNGSDTEAQMNYTQPSTPLIIPSSIIPPDTYTPTNVFTNITGFYRSATVHPLSLEEVPSHLPEYWKHVTSFPSLNSSSDAIPAEDWNATKAEEMRGSWDWAATTRWDMNLKERNISAPTIAFDDDEDGTISKNMTVDQPKIVAGSDGDIETYPEWTWVKGSGTLTTSEKAAEGKQSITYDFYGLHYKPNGTYNLYAMPEGMRVDIRKLPYLWTSNSEEKADQGAAITAKETKEIILRELEKEVAVQEDLLILSDVRDDDISEVTTCPLLIHLTLPSLPRGTSKEEIEAYEKELQNPTGLLSSMRRPPRYWESGVGLGGVIVADGCGWAMGIEGGQGMAVYDFWNESIRYSVYAGFSQLVVLLLLVRQMESTRTPSTLAKVSLYTIIIMSITDSWVFSAHIVVAIMSDNRASLSMIIPAFLCFATAVVFGPRYAVLLHRIQLPESGATPSTPAIGQANANANNAAGQPEVAGDAGMNAAAALVSTQRRMGAIAGGLRSFFIDHPLMKWICILGFLFLFINIAFLPNVIPFFVVGLYSFWVPQIWRNARRGNSQVMDPTFIIGTTAGRLALPLYAFAYSDNIFFVEKASWVWLLVVWQLVQVGLLFAQERFGPAFLLPKSLAPPESYNYHPLIPNKMDDPESSTPLLSSSGDGEAEKTCSICMEEVDLAQSSLASNAGLGGLGDKRRSYALAPCGHLFHTKCLSQWMAVKTICPLCKRSLPPL